MTSPTLSDLSPETLNLLKTQTIELPSWAFGNSGTRFRVFTTAGVPRDPYEKIDDVAQVNAFTGITPRVSLHIPWDKTDDYDALRRHAEDRGIRIGTINSNVFQDDDYKLGSLTNPDERVRAKAIAHHLECIDIMRATSAPALKIWLPDGTNYPGQDSIRERQDRLADSLSQIYAALDDDQLLVLEYKFFEPAFYHTDVPDWGTSLVHCLSLGERAKVVLDTGHHAPGTNIEFIVAQLVRLGRLGAFDFNSRFYADDDLIVGAADPYQLFRIMNEIVAAGALASDSGVNFMLDQCHNLEEKIPGEIRSATNVQEATQLAGDVLAANDIFIDAFNTDVRPMLAELRESQGLAPDPMRAFLDSGYLERVRSERVGGNAAGWGA